LYITQSAFNNLARYAGERAWKAEERDWKAWGTGLESYTRQVAKALLFQYG